MKPYEKFRTRMLDTSCEDKEREWCYLAKSTTVIGVPFQPDVTQVTFDGALFTKHAELCFFYGENHTPLLARQKTFYEGWIPVVEYEWSLEEIAYKIQMFGAILEGENEDNTLNFVKVTMHNQGKEEKKGVFTAAMRNTAKDFRFQGLDFSEHAPSKYYPMDFEKEWEYEMTEDKVWRDHKLIYEFTPCTKKYAVADKVYSNKFKGEDYNVQEETATCCTQYSMMLKEDEKASFVLKMPRVPVGREDVVMIQKIMQADYETYLEKTIAYWQELVTTKTQYFIPEKRVQDGMKASLVHLMLATRKREGKYIQTDGLPYPNFFLTSAPQMVLAYLSLGHTEHAKRCILDGVSQQEADGLYFDKSLAHGGVIPTAHGHIMYAAAAYCLMSQDKETASSIYSSLQKAVAYIKCAIEKDEYGLLPPTYPYDNEMIAGHYTCNNIWALLGLRYVIRLAEWLGEIGCLEEWKQLEARYYKNILKGIEASVDEDGYVPTGLYEFLTGKQTGRNFEAYQTNCDWENMILAYPTEILDPMDYRVKGTLDKVRQGYAEGIMTYRHGMHLHQYITANMIEQYMVRGESYTALKDFYHLLLHSGSTHEGFENLVKPWTDRQVEEECPSPHAWAAAKVVFLTRNLLLHEFRGKLYLFPVISPAWAMTDKSIEIKNALTEMGRISAKMTFLELGAQIKIQSDWHGAPDKIMIRIPYFKKIIEVISDAKESSMEQGCITLSSDATEVSIRWEENKEAHMGVFEDILKEYRQSNSFEGIDEQYKPIIKKGEAFILEEEIKNEAQILSFDKVKEIFQYEYERRVKEFEANQGELTKVILPRL